MPGPIRLPGAALPASRPVWVAAMVLPIGATVLAGCAGQPDPRAGEASAPPSWLMVVQAAGGTYDGSSATLTLTDTDPRALAFTDRPNRQAARLSAKAFLDSWDQAFANDPPNAAVVVSGAAPEQDMIAVQLGRPSYTDQGTVTFPITPVSGTPVPVAGREADASLPAEFQDAAVFIDSYICLNLTPEACGDGAQIGAAWGASASPARTPTSTTHKTPRATHSPRPAK